MNVRSWVRFGLVRGLLGAIVTVALYVIVAAMLNVLPVPIPIQINWATLMVAAIFGTFIIAGLYVLFAYLLKDVVELKPGQEMLGIVVVAALVGFVSAIFAYTAASPIVEPIKPSSAILDPYTISGPYVNQSVAYATYGMTFATEDYEKPSLLATVVGSVIGEIVMALITVAVIRYGFKWEVPSLR